MPEAKLGRKNRRIVMTGLGNNDRGQNNDPLQLQPLKSRGCEATEQRGNSGSNYYVVRGGDSGAYVRMNATYFELLSMMDGETSLNQIIARLHSNSEKLDPETLPDFLTLLYRNGIIVARTDEERGVFAASTSTEHTVKRSIASRIGQKIIRWRIGVPHSNRLVTLLYGKIGWLLFSRTTLLAFSLILLIGVPLSAYQLWTSAEMLKAFFLVRDIPITGLVAIYIGVAVATILHELAHALTCAHYGREVTSFGIMVYYGTPVCYTDTSDCWMLPKSKRVMVAAAGIVTNLCIGALCSITSSLLSSTLAFQILMTLAVINYLSAVLNLIPFLKFDGYYILSDILDKPLLREEALALVLDRGTWKKLYKRNRHLRFQISFLVFGLCSIIFGGIALAFAAVGIYAFVMKIIPQPYNVVLSLGAVVLLILPAISFAADCAKASKPVRARRAKNTKSASETN